MKIITPGFMPPPSSSWPFGFRFLCARCSCEFEIENGDDVIVATEKRPNGKTTVTFACPTCGVGMTFYRYGLTGDVGFEEQP
ncbi:MAG: hypothetical protein JO250_09230 [Armatimonadetes bacterium]|nr:hypothetical protein [Armatimonadota bacterium]